MRAACFLPVLVVAAWLQAGALARAQQRPLTTEDPEVIGDGRVLIEAGVETGSNAWYPLSGLHGDRFAVPVGLCLGLGRYAELQLDAGYKWLGIDSREDAPLAFRVPADITRTSDIIDADRRDEASDLRRGRATVHRLAALRDATAQRLATRAASGSTRRISPSASWARKDDSDRSASSGNAGIGILSGTRSSRRSSTTLSWAACRWRVRCHAGRDVVGEVTGAEGVVRGLCRRPARSRSARFAPPRAIAAARARFDGGVLAGFTRAIA